MRMMQYHQVVYACVSNGVITSHNSGTCSHNTTDVIKNLCPMSYTSLSTVLCIWDSSVTIQSHICYVTICDCKMYIHLHIVILVLITKFHNNVHLILHVFWNVSQPLIVSIAFYDTKMCN